MKIQIKNWIRSLVVKTLFPVDQNRGWIPLIQESSLGAWQTDETPVSLNTSMSHPTVYACVSQIAYDIGKLRLNLTKIDNNGIANVVKDSKITPVLKKPNKYQTKQKFIESWLISLLSNGNTYILKTRNNLGTVTRLDVLDPSKVEVLVSDDGSVFYRLKTDHLTNVNKDFVAVPAYEIIHDTMITLFHPLMGVTPLYASYRAISQGIAIQEHSQYFFQNKARPGGFLTAPGQIKKEVADEMRTAWHAAYSGENTGKVAILSDGLQYKSIGENATDSDLINQLKWSDEKICSAFKVPPYKVHVGQAPTYQQSETLDRKYYSDCLQRHIESIESLLDEGLELPENYGIQFNLEDLMRMDMSLKMQTAAEGVKGGIMAPNEAREKFNLRPVKGGNTPYLQQQNFSLAALDERDKESPLSINNNESDEEMKKYLFSMKLKRDIIGEKK